MEVATPLHAHITINATDAALHCNTSLGQSRYMIRAVPSHWNPWDELGARLQRRHEKFPCTPCPKSYLNLALIKHCRMATNKEVDLLPWNRQ